DYIAARFSKSNPMGSKYYYDIPSGIVEKSVDLAIGSYLYVLSTGDISATIFNADTGYRIGGAAATGEYLRGNGTNFVSSAIVADDLGAGYINATTDLLGTLCGTNQILEDQGAAWACIATPSGGAPDLQDAYDNETAPALITQTNALGGIIFDGDLETAEPVLIIRDDVTGQIGLLIDNDSTDTVFPIVESTATTSTPLQEDHTVNLPSGIVDGDLLLIFVDIEDTAAGITFPGGWTQFFFVSDGINRMWGFWRDADGTEGATISVTTTPFAERGVYNAYRISGAEDPIITQPPEVTTFIGANLPSLTPTGGAKDYLWLVVLGTSSSGGAPPANYGNEVSVINFNSMESARRELNAASEDPGDYAGGGANKLTATIAIHPFPARDSPI
ncbi:hypothetical protein LCGC14_2887990, partial [marine sediment metagenome]